MFILVLKFSSGRNEGATEIAQEAQWRQCGGFGCNQNQAERRVRGGGLLVCYHQLTVLLLVLQFSSCVLCKIYERKDFKPFHVLDSAKSVTP